MMNEDNTVAGSLALNGSRQILQESSKASSEAPAENFDRKIGLSEEVKSAIESDQLSRRKDSGRDENEGKLGRESEDERGKEQREKAERVMGQRKELWEERGKMRKSTEKVPIQTVVRINLVFFLKPVLQLHSIFF